MNPIVLYGTPGSLYTGKVRSYLRKQRIPYEERTAGDPRYRGEVMPVVGRWIIPVLQTPEGDLVQDGADIIDHLEARGLGMLPAYPEADMHRVLSHVFELFGGEGLLRPAMHYRWNFDDVNLDFLRDDFGAGLAAPGSTLEEKAVVFDRASGAMRKATVAFGVTPESIPEIERSYLDFVARFDAHLAEFPYLLGGSPTIGDYGLIAPLFAHLGRDPYPAMRMKQLAPRVWRWVERMHSPEQGTGEYRDRGAGLFACDPLSVTLQSLLRFVAQDYLPELQAHVAFTNAWLAARPDLQAGHNGLEKPGGRAIGMATFPWRGQMLQSVVMPYRLYLLQRVQDAFEKLDEPQRRVISGVMDDVGLAFMLTLKATRRVERRQHLEVWGAPQPAATSQGPERAERKP